MIPVQRAVQAGPIHVKHIPNDNRVNRIAPGIGRGRILVRDIRANPIQRVNVLNPARIPNVSKSIFFSFVKYII